MAFFLDSCQKKIGAKHWVNLTLFNSKIQIGQLGKKQFYLSDGKFFCKISRPSKEKLIDTKLRKRFGV